MIGTSSALFLSRPQSFAEKVVKWSIKECDKYHGGSLSWRLECEHKKTRKVNKKTLQKNFSSKMSKIKYAKDNKNPFKFDCWSKKTHVNSNFFATMCSIGISHNSGLFSARVWPDKVNRAGGHVRLEDVIAAVLKGLWVVNKHRSHLKVLENWSWP